MHTYIPRVINVFHLQAVREQYVGCDYTIWPSLEVIFSGPPIGIEYTNTELNGWLIADKSKMRQVSPVTLVYSICMRFTTQSISERKY